MSVSAKAHPALLTFTWKHTGGSGAGGSRGSAFAESAAYLDVPGRRKSELHLDQLKLCRVNIPVVLQDRALERGHDDASTPHPKSRVRIRPFFFTTSKVVVQVSSSQLYNIVKH